MVRCAAAAALVSAAAMAASAQPQRGATILVYHRFGPVVADSMTVTTPVFESQIGWLRDHGYRFVRLRAVVDALCGHGPALPPRAVAITADDGHKTVYSDMFPIVRRNHIPVTLFIYPSAISNASYALTWDQIADMLRAGGVTVQSHTYWHPNFQTERRRLDDAAWRAFVDMQLTRSRDRLAQRLHIPPPDMLAWPFGIHDAALETAAARTGYVAGFTLERKAALPGADCLALPRYLITDRDRGARFAAIFRAKP